MGLLWYAHAGATTKITDSSDNRDSAATNLIGAVIFGEYIFYSRYGIGLKVGYLTKELELEINSNDATVNETSLLFMLEGRSHFVDHGKNGFKPHLGIGLGAYNTTTDLAVKDSTTGDTEKESGSILIPVVSISCGADYTADRMGVRAELTFIYGSKSEENILGDYDGRWTYTGIAINIATFLFFKNIIIF